MFHLLIVEDEKRTREGLCRHIDWNGIGVDPVTAVAGGMEALLAVDDIKPDILLSDIRMPHMTGIELATIIRKKFPRCKIIFLSGYADKEYLMSAIELKVVNYIEKPIDVVEIRKAVSKAVMQLESEQKEELIHDGFQKALPIIHEEIVSALVSPGLDWQRFSQDFIPLYFEWTKIGNYSLSCIRPVKKLAGDAGARAFLSSVARELEQAHGLAPDDYLLSLRSSREAVLIYRNLPSSVMTRILGDLQASASKSQLPETAIGISWPCLSLTEIPELYAAVSRMTEYESFYYENYGTITFAEPLPLKEVPKNIFRLKELTLSGAETLFDTLAREKYTDIPYIRGELYKIYMMTIEKSWDERVVSWGAFETLSLAEYRELIYYEVNTIQLLGGDIYDIKIKNAVHYILWNYSNPDLSIKVIADHVNLSQNYLSTLFKKQTGVTINDFLLNIRAEKACRLLSDTDLKLYEIAERIGLLDANYLSTVFKRQYGVTPTQYSRTTAKFPRREKLHEGDS